MREKFKFKPLILWEDEDYMAVNKPPFLSTLEDRNEPVNLLALARELVPAAQACHRLDKNTSGVVVFAKNPEAYRRLSVQFEKRQVVKTYHAVADGLHRFENLKVTLPIVKQNDGTVTISKQRGKPSETWFTTLKTYRAHSLLECRPVTGRMHQIRIHLASLGAPITGDETYGGNLLFLSQIKRRYNLKKGTEEKPIINRLALHSLRLRFTDMQGTDTVVEAPYPKDFRALLRQLEENS